MAALGSGNIWILVPDWSRLKSLEPKGCDVTCKIGPLYFIQSEYEVLFVTQISWQFENICKTFSQ